MLCAAISKTVQRSSRPPACLMPTATSERSYFFLTSSTSS
jgi:hypothetical protein